MSERKRKTSGQNKQSEPGETSRQSKAIDQNDLSTTSSESSIRESGNSHVTKASKEPQIQTKSSTESKSNPKRDTKSEKKTFGKTLVDLLVTRHFELWHDEAGSNYLTGRLGGPNSPRRLTLPIESEKCIMFVRQLAWKKFKRPVTNYVLQEVIDQLSAIATFEGRQHRLYVRVAKFPDVVYLDLADSTGSIVEMRAAGYRITSDADIPVHFYRPDGMKPLPQPRKTGKKISADQLKKLFRLDDGQLLVLLGFLICCLSPHETYPVLVLYGGQGSGKSTLIELIRFVLDAMDQAHAALPRSDRDLGRVNTI